MHIRTKQHKAIIEYYICHQCNELLRLNENYMTRDLFWKSFLLCVLENTTLHYHYSGDCIWHFFPADSCYWWIHKMKLKFLTDSHYLSKIQDFYLMISQ